MVWELSLHRLEAYFHTCDELLHMWAHAEDLDTLEFTLMQIIAYIAGPVRIGIPTPLLLLSACRLLALLTRMLLHRMWTLTWRMMYATCSFDRKWGPSYVV